MREALESTVKWQMIKTQRTYIRPIEISDETDLFEIYSKQEVFEHFGSGVYTREEHVESIESAVKRWVENGKGDLVAVYSGKVIARLILFPFDTENYEIGYVLDPTIWGRGFAKELAIALLDHAFQLGAPVVTACVRESNSASRHIIRSLGFEETERKIGDNGIKRIYYSKYSESVRNAN